MRITALLLGLLLSLSIFGSVEPEPGADKGGMIVGKVVDASSDQAIEYANIAVYNAKDSTLITGGITDAEGRFSINSLKPGEYYATIKFMGFLEVTKEKIIISREQPFAKIGRIALEKEMQNLDEVVVMADKQQVVYKIDKKIVHPSQFLVAQGGTAVDVLENTPSVEVDIEGNVSMRGSSNFMVLINGKPTPFEASDALAQVPASTIENIEIITNPSAKYDPDGAAGIINIITKKNAQKGWNGIANASANTQGSYSGDFIFNFTGNRTRWYIGGNRRDRLRLADYSNLSGTIDPILLDTTHILQEGIRSMNFVSNSLKTGFDFDINEKNSIGLEVQGGTHGRYFDSDLTNDEWATGTDPITTFAEAITEANGLFGSLTLSQKSQFGSNKDHKLESSFYYQIYEGDDNTFSNKIDIDDVSIITQETWEESSSTDLRFKTDYTRPWKKGKMEAGYQLSIDDSWSNYDAAFDTLADNSIFYSENNFYRMINSGYATFSGESGRFGYQLGLRGEHTLRQLSDINNELISDINRMDWYPTAHFSFNLDDKQSLMASYTRRIDRPRSWWLDPYLAWRDPNNVRQGNPNLLPEYINSYEMSYQWRFGERNFFSAELYHRNVIDKIERTRSTFEDGILMTSFENVGQDFSTGLEFMLNYNLTKWWSANLSASVYDYRIDIDEDFTSSLNEAQSNNWRGRMSNTFKPSQSLRIQFDAMYRSPTVTATGSRSAMAYTSLAIKKSFFTRKLDVGVSVRDVFNTARMKSSGSSTTYYSEYEFDMRSPIVQFSISYLFNNYKPERQQGQDRENGGSMDMEY